MCIFLYIYIYIFSYVTSGWSRLAVVKGFPSNRQLLHTPYFVNYHTDIKKIKQTSKKACIARLRVLIGSIYHNTAQIICLVCVCEIYLTSV